jgi:DNA-binding response OmpR family regulator
MRILFVTGPQKTGSWLAEAFTSDSACDVHLETPSGVAEGLGRLREVLFDAVLIGHEPGAVDALEVMDAIRAGSSDEQPVIVLGEDNSRSMEALCYEAGADAYLCLQETTTRSLIWVVSRAMERHELLADNRRLQQQNRHRLQLEHDEVSRLIEQQRQMLAEKETLSSRAVHEMAERLPQALRDHYRELLRSYVMMGSGNLRDEIRVLAELLARAHVSPKQTMALHVCVLERLVEGKGSRSARHLLNRGDMLILEMMIHIARHYRSQLMQCIRPQQQLMLPGFTQWLADSQLQDTSGHF